MKINENINNLESNEDMESENNSINSENGDSFEESSEYMYDNQIIPKYKKENYNIKDIITILMNADILKNKFSCTNCNELIYLIKI